MGLLDNVISTISTVAGEALKNDSVKEIISSLNNGSAGNGGSIDIASGLKEALRIGIETAAKNLSKEDGFLADAAVRIGLPKEALSAFNAVQSISQNPTFNSLLNATGVTIPTADTIITLFNRAAENAAPQSVGIFTDAITGMSIGDAKQILFGADNAATTYLKDNTQTQLQSAFIPSITQSLSAVKIGNMTPNDAWNTYASYNNKIVEMLDNKTVKTGLELVRMTGLLSDEYFEKIRNLSEVKGDLPEYITGEALNGLFLKVSEKEADIRHNTGARVNDVLKSVFGMLQN